MDQRAIIDVVCKSGVEKLASEIGTLLGQELVCSEIQLDLISKEKLFSNPARAKTALTRMSVSGDREGHCYLLTSLSAAVILGGTLIMLPQDMIEENVQSGKLDGELNDAFGEVANIIAGVFTQSFVDKYSKTIRFIKKSVEELIPTKIDPAGDEPFPPGSYYVASCVMTLDEDNLGTLEFVVPAAIFDLAPLPEPAPEAPIAEQQQAPPPTSSVQSPAEAEEPPAEASPAAAVPALKKTAFADAKKLADVVFNTIISQAGEEIGTLLGQTLKCDDIKLVMTSKADFFSSICVDKSVMTKMKVTGDRQGLGFMVAQVPDAIILGGTLIMLPEDQIEEQKNAGQFDGEVADAYGEIANILSGSLTQVFLERYPKQLRFIKTDTETLVPTKLDPAAAEPFPEGQYYLASFAIHMEDYDLHRLHLIFPAEVFDLDSNAATEPSQPAAATTGQNAQAAQGVKIPEPGEWGGPAVTENTTGTPAPAVPQDGFPHNAEPAGPPLLLLVSDQPKDAEPFVEILATAGYDCRALSYQDEVKELFQQHRILGIFLIMAQVGEKGFAAAIKLQAAGRPLPPIIFAGPEWTRSAVLRAVKYGARDILVMPASGDEIQEKVSQHILKAS